VNTSQKSGEHKDGHHQALKEKDGIEQLEEWLATQEFAYHPWEDNGFLRALKDIGFGLCVVVGILVVCSLLAGILLIFRDYPHLVGEAHGWVQTDNNPYGKLHWRQKRATLNLRLGCPTNEPCWDAVAREVAEEWNDAGSRFRFRLLDSSRPGKLSCTRADNINTVLWAARNCGRLIQPDTLAFTSSWTWDNGRIADFDVVFNTAFTWDVYTGPYQYDRPDFRRIALHEFGHALGLDHPDDYGQQVEAIMNAIADNIDTLQPDDIAGVQAIYGVDPDYEPPVVGFLENPGLRSFRSGVGILSGWVCAAKQVEVQIGATRYLMAYGTDRPDTRGECGDANNGFVTLFNYNILGTGTHTARLLVNGRQHGDPVEFKVTTFGREFLRNAQGAYTVLDFPRSGTNPILIWDQNAQNFMISGFE